MGHGYQLRVMAQRQTRSVIALSGHKEGHLEVLEPRGEGTEGLHEVPLISTFLEGRGTNKNVVDPISTSSPMVGGNIEFNNPLYSTTPIDHSSDNRFFLAISQMRYHFDSVNHDMVHAVTSQISIVLKLIVDPYQRDSISVARNIDRLVTTITKLPPLMGPPPTFIDYAPSVIRPDAPNFQYGDVHRPVTLSD